MLPAPKWNGQTHTHIGSTRPVGFASSKKIQPDRPKRGRIAKNPKMIGTLQSENAKPSKVALNKSFTYINRFSSYLNSAIPKVSPNHPWNFQSVHSPRQSIGHPLESLRCFWWLRRIKSKGWLSSRFNKRVPDDEASTFASSTFLPCHPRLKCDSSDLTTLNVVRLGR